MRLPLFFFVFLLIFGSGFLFSEEFVTPDVPVTTEAQPDTAFQNDTTVVDDLFDDPTGDVVTQQTGNDLTEQYTKNDRLVFSGSFSGSAIAAAGWVQMPDITDPLEGFANKFGGIASTTLTMDARPDPAFRLYGSVVTSVDTAAMSWSIPSVSELFVDYTLLDSVFFRAGKHSLSWGQGRLLSQLAAGLPGDLLKGSGDGLALKVSVPALLDGVTAVVLAKSEYLPSMTDFGYGIKAEKVLFDTYLGISGFYQASASPKAVLSVKRTFFGTDVFADFLVRFSQPSLGLVGLTGFYHQWSDPDIILYGEYQVDGSDINSLDHQSALFIGCNNIFGTVIDFGLKWFHAFSVNSGMIVPGVVFKPFSHVKVSIGLPILYGGDIARYNAIKVESSSDKSYNLDYRIALVMDITLSGTF